MIPNHMCDCTLQGLAFWSGLSGQSAMPLDTILCYPNLLCAFLISIVAWGHCEHVLKEFWTRGFALHAQGLWHLLQSIKKNRTLPNENAK